MPGKYWLRVFLETWISLERPPNKGGCTGNLASMWHMVGGGEPFFELSLGGGERIFDTPARGAKRFLAKCHSLYNKCREEVSEVVHLNFWPC